MISRRSLLAAATGLLASCAPAAVGAVDAHEIILYGPNERHVILYGEEGVARETTLNGKAVTLAKPPTTAPAGSLNVPGALWVDGQPTIKLPSRAVGERFSLATAPMTRDVVLSTRGRVGGVYYFDGRDWYTVANAVNGDTRLRYTPVTRREGLRGVGDLTTAEADALARYLQPRGPLAVALLEDVDIADSLVDLKPMPRVWDRTALLVQTGVPVDVLGNTVRKAGALSFRQLLAGGNSAYSDPAPLVHLDTNLTQLRETWQFVGGNVVPPPALPNVNFVDERVVTVFLGQKPTGGYGMTVDSVAVENDVLVVRVNVRTPGAGTIVTQSLTSPFVSIAVSGPPFTSVRVLDKATGQELTRTKPRKVQ
ncbi:MAG TPA: protease complex subunit PrcB family protein [Deinococcales bacterium]|nr:protease complex subunit PrcB family protein [Deinococcales bacterium]